jgi:energy-coupling factor transport system ATP-binding protein
MMGRTVDLQETKDAICLEQVSFTYAGVGKPALRDISLCVRPGELVVIIGASGAGKSTLVKCLNRVIPAFQPGELSGKVQLFGRTLVYEKVGELAGTVGMVFQDFEAQLFSTTVRDEIIFGMEQLGVDPLEMRRRFDDALTQVGLAGFETRDPTTLSGGQKQRLAIAALLALRPQVLVFDEPTTDLDPQGRQEIFSLLGRMRSAGHTLVLVEHELSAAVDADRVILLSDGQIVAAGPPADLLSRIDLLTRHGVRPRDLDRLCASLQLDAIPKDLEKAARLIQALFSVPVNKKPCLGASGSPSEVHAFHATTVAASLQESQPPSRTIDSFLQLRSISHIYPGNAPALADINCSIKEGEFIALLGQNGSGKTTLAKILSGLLIPSQGRVFLHGRELHDLPLHSIAQEMSYVFQNPDHQLFADTVEAEVAFGPKNIGLDAIAVETRVQEALEAVGLASLRQQDPFLLGRGERQRLAVAAVLALRPRLLVLDEPTTGLDHREQRQMMELLRRLHQEGRTIVIITHVPWVAAEYAERALLMARGRLLWDGPLRDMCLHSDLCTQAAFLPPEITQLGLRFGFAPLTVDEFVASVDRKIRA